MKLLLGLNVSSDLLRFSYIDFFYDSFNTFNVILLFQPI